MKFILRREEIEVTRKDIEKIITDLKNIRGRGKSYYACVKGKKIPVKNLLYEILKKKGYGFTLLDFTTGDAVRILKRIKIDVKNEKEIGTGEYLLKFAGVLEIGGNALEDERRLY